MRRHLILLLHCMILFHIALERIIELNKFGSVFNLLKNTSEVVLRRFFSQVNVFSYCFIFHVFIKNDDVILKITVTSLSEMKCSRTHFEVLDFEASSPRKLRCPRLENSTIF